MAPRVIEAWRPVLVEIVATQGDGERRAGAGRGTETLNAGVKCRDRAPLRSVFRHHFFLALDFRLAELPFHNPGALQCTRGNTQTAVAELL